MLDKDNIYSENSNISNSAYVKAYTRLFENNPLPMFLYNIDSLKFISVNDSFVKLYGYSKDEVTMMSIADIRPTEDIPNLLNHLTTTRNEELRNINVRHKKKDGTIIYVDITSQAINFGGHKARFVTAIDVTEKRLISQRIKQLNTAIQQSPISIVMTDTDGNIEYANQRALDLTGYTLEELTGKNPRILSTGEKSKDEYKELWDTILAGDEWRGEFHNKKKTGELYWEYARITPIKNDEGVITHFLAIKEDITERKAKDAELISAKEKAEEMNRIKSNFFSNMSHELRTPLSGILGFSELLLEDIKDLEQKKMVEAISMNGQRLLNTLNQILHISKLESDNPGIELEDICVNEFIEKVTKNFETNLISKGLYIKIYPSDEKIYARLDSEIFKTIINNILSNAIKFTPKGGITITCSKFVRNYIDMIKIEIIDTGIGISPENQKFIFDEFRQASEGLNRYYEGTGLGLTIAKKYTELLKGKIYLESKVGEGSTFTLEFPMSQNISDKQSEKYDFDEAVFVDEEGKKPLVLLVEDDYMNMDLIISSLKNLCELHTAESGEEALKLVKLYKYDTILMDIGLGLGINGIETTQRIRLMSEYKNTPIIAVTAYALSGDKQKFLASGLTGYISKPFQMHELVEVIGKALKLI